ncbi:hypothetical protein [Nocardia jinanensis]|nr:hypothetical protein [Nocardia jinanensis]
MSEPLHLHRRALVVSDRDQVYVRAQDTAAAAAANRGVQQLVVGAVVRG